MQEVTFGGVPAWLLTAYLVELDGAEEAPDVVRGDGWTATLVDHPREAGGFGLGRVTVTIGGSSAEETMAALRKKAQRGGG